MARNGKEWTKATNEQANRAEGERYGCVQHAFDYRRSESYVNGVII